MPLDPVILTAACAVLLFLLVAVLVLRAGTARRLVQSQGEAADLRHRLTLAEAQAGRVEPLEQERRALDDRYRAEQLERGRLEQEMKSLREHHAERLSEITTLKKEVEEKFESLAGSVLKSNSENFLGLVSERFRKHSAEAGHDLTTRQTAIENMVKPLAEKLGAFDHRIQEIEKARQDAYGAIRTQVEQLSQQHVALGQETRKLVQALRAPKTRGRWGEMQLRQVFEMAGMTDHVDYRMEQQIDTEAGARRPDAVVNIPGGKTIVIDAKTPLEAYLDAIDCEGPDEQQGHIRRHAAQVRAHVKNLASKSYQDSIETTPDFVVMFIPGETFVAAAAECDPDLIEYAFRNKVLIATPTTLMALVKAIAYGWQQEKMAANAAEVQKQARELYDRLGVFAGHLGKVGRTLSQSVEHYNRAVGSMESRVLPSARKFEAMGVVAAKDPLAAPDGVTVEPRALSAEADRPAELELGDS